MNSQTNAHFVDNTSPGVFPNFMQINNTIIGSICHLRSAKGVGFM